MNKHLILVSLFLIAGCDLEHPFDPDWDPSVDLHFSEVWLGSETQGFSIEGGYEANNRRIENEKKPAVTFSIQYKGSSWCAKYKYSTNLAASACDVSKYHLEKLDDNQLVEKAFSFVGCDQDYWICDGWHMASVPYLEEKTLEFGHYRFSVEEIAVGGQRVNAQSFEFQINELNSIGGKIYGN